MITYADALHEIIRINVLNGNLSNMTSRIYFDRNFREFINTDNYDTPENAYRSIDSKYKKLYKPLILDERFEFRIKSANNIGVFAAKDIYDIGNDIFVGAFTQHLSETASLYHPSCVERQLAHRSESIHKRSSNSEVAAAILLAARLLLARLSVL